MDRLPQHEWRQWDAGDLYRVLGVLPGSVGIFNPSEPQPDTPTTCDEQRLGGCPTSQLCAQDTLRTVIENTTAAGIFVNVSAGNSGPNSSTVDTPPSHYAASYSTGALITGTRRRSSVSAARARSRSTAPTAPSPTSSRRALRPRSSTNASDLSYASFQGASMASPHVVGVVALLWHAVAEPLQGHRCHEGAAEQHGESQHHGEPTGRSAVASARFQTTTSATDSWTPSTPSRAAGHLHLRRRLRHHRLRHHHRLRPPATG